jgi:hypothetical protein
VEHFIVTTGPPVASKFCHLDPEKLAAAKADFDKMEAEGIIRRSTSPWSSPLHLVMKEDGTWRPCGDFRRLNLVTVPDVYPLPNMLDFAAKMSGCMVFSKIDLQNGYHQIPMHEADIPKTAITTLRISLYAVRSKKRWLHFPMPYGQGSVGLARLLLVPG